jgi:hypothetical protein
LNLSTTMKRIGSSYAIGAIGGVPTNRPKLDRRWW